MRAIVCTLALLPVLAWSLRVSAQAGSVPGEEIVALTLDEDRAAIARKFGSPAEVDDTQPGFESWYLRGDAQDQHEFGLVFCFRKADGKLVSVTRNLDPERTVDVLFPDAQTVTQFWPAADAPQWGARVRTLDGDRVLLAIGSTAAGKPTGQLILMRRSALPIFFPWIVNAPAVR